MKVLYCGNYREHTGWGNAAKGYILALDAVGVDVVPRPIHFTNDGEYPERIKELEQKSSKGCDIIIQHTLPCYYQYCGKFKKNIGLYVTETDNFNNTNWTQHINIMDQAWVACTDSIEHSKNSNVEVDIKVIPHAFDISKYNNYYSRADIPSLKNKFVFYFIGEFSRRKNLAALLRAYHTEFHLTEPVALLIKTYVRGMSPSESMQHVVDYCRTIKNELRLYSDVDDYLNEVIITDFISNDQIMQLHATCDCYVGPSFGEGWNIEAFDAMAMGKTPICTNQGGPKDFIARENTRHKTEYGGWLVDGHKEQVFGMSKWAMTPNLYTANEYWTNVDICKLRKAMRDAYENSQEKEKRAIFGYQRANDFSYENVGKVMLEILEC